MAILSVAGLAAAAPGITKGELQRANAQTRARSAKRIVIDALSSPQTLNVEYPPRGPLTPAQLENCRLSGINAVNLTLTRFSFEDTVKELAFWQREIARHPDRLLRVDSIADIALAKRSDRLGLIFGLQGLNMIGTDLQMIDAFATFGVRIVQITYNDRNSFGSGSTRPDTEGLSELGREAVALLNAKRLVVDLSHANVQTALDIANASKRPVAITHTGCRAIFDHPRNMPDPVLRAVADKGGVVGIFLMPFLGRDPVHPTRALVTRHLDHALRTCGEDHVGIGSDLSITPIEITPAYLNAVRDINIRRSRAGIAAPMEAEGPITVPELNSVRRMEMITDDLTAAGYASSVVDKVIGGNFLRLFAEVWG